MSHNLWSIQVPIKRIDFYFKIDDHKKHLQKLINVKSTFKKTKIFDFLKNKENDIRHLSYINDSKSGHQKSYSLVINVDNKKIQDYNQKQQSNSQKMNLSKINSKNSSPKYSPKKYQKQLNYIRREQNKNLLKKLESVKPSAQLCQSKLGHKYSNSDLKYRVNIQRTRYRNVDFTRQAQRLLKGEKIEFSKIGNLEEKERNKKQKPHVMGANLDWKLSDQKQMSTQLIR